MDSVQIQLHPSDHSLIEDCTQVRLYLGKFEMGYLYASESLTGYMLYCTFYDF